jgi:hypothetical protein
MTRRQRFHFAAFTPFASIVSIATMTLFLLTPAASFASSDSAVPASCPVTRPSEPAFVPPAPYPGAPPSAPHAFWHGAPGLWTMLSSTGVLRGMISASPSRPGAFSTRDKVFWWSPGFHPIGTPDPPLKIEGRRLDGEAPRLAQPWVTNAHVPDWGGWTMLIMLELPTEGCWEVTGTYYGNYVTFVVWATS